MDLKRLFSKDSGHTESTSVQAQSAEASGHQQQVTRSWPSLKDIMRTPLYTPGTFAAQGPQDAHSCKYCQRVVIDASNLPTWDDTTEELVSIHIPFSLSQIRSAIRSGCTLFRRILEFETDSRNDWWKPLSSKRPFLKVIGSTTSLVKHGYLCIQGDLLKHFILYVSSPARGELSVIYKTFSS